MANTYHQMYVQCVFAVKYRRAVIKKEWRPELMSVMGNLINETGCKNIIVNGVEDHVHCFFAIRPIDSVSEIMKTVKAKSSKHINDHLLTPRRFEWQRGFGAFTYCHSHIDRVYRYIANQEAHHHKQTFKKEYLEYLDHHNIPYDERYLFEDPI